MAKTRVCANLFMRPGCGDPFRVRRFSRARQCSRCQSAFLVPVREMEQVGAVRVTDVGLFGHRKALVSGWESLRHPRVRGLELIVDIGAIVDDRFDVPPSADLDAAGNLGRHAGLFLPALPPSGLVLDGAAVSDGFKYNN